MGTRRNLTLVAVALLIVAGGAVVFVVSQERSQFRSVADLVRQIEERGPDCSGPLEVSAGKVAGDGPYYEAGDCSRFDDYDVANFYWFPDTEAMDAYISYQQELVDGWDFDGVIGPNWFAGIREMKTAIEVQEVVGGELNGY